MQIKAPYDDLFVPQKFAAEMADRLHIRLLDPLPYLREYGDGDPLFYDQCHFTERGNKVMSGFLVPQLRDWKNSNSR